MAKKGSESAFFCQNCGYESAKWVGQCPACHTWNSMVEEVVRRDTEKNVKYTGSVKAVLSTIDAIELDETARTSSGIPELDRVLGGGVVQGSMVLVGGDPGIGKSTLLLQVCRNMSAAGHSILYVSGEESLKQIKMRAMRLGKFTDTMKLYCETDMDSVAETIRNVHPEAVVIDSIQTMINSEVTSAAGSVSQVRESTGVLMQLAKGFGITIFIVGHVTKDGSVAGPKVLEHMVDTVLYFEGDTRGTYRILRGVKNRFGSTDEIGVFEMHEDGLSEVENPSEFMLSGRPDEASGNVVTCSMEGTRPILVEIQALVCDSSFGFPKRQATGTDFNRVNLLMAVLEKRVGLRLGQSDAYVNIAGGIRMNEPALDLGIVIAIISSYKNKPVDRNMVAFGEVGLSGEVRAVSMCLQRVREAQKLGFSSVIIPNANLSSMKEIKGVKIISVRSIADVIDVI